MPQKTVLIPDVGEVLLVKRRGTKNLKLSVTSTGKVRVSMPPWVPYYTAENFASSKSDWIQKHIKKHSQSLLIPNASIGKSHKLVFIASSSERLVTKVTPTEVKIFTKYNYRHPAVQEKAKAASEKALKQEAETLLPVRLQELAQKHSYTFKSVKIKKLTSRWGSCSSHKEITLSYYLMQLPWRLIDYVLVHELVHTKNMNHGGGFWQDFTDALPNVRQLQKEIRTYSPRLESNS